MPRCLNGQEQLISLNIHKGNSILVRSSPLTVTSSLLTVPYSTPSCIHILSQSLGKFFYTLYKIPFVSAADLVLAFLMTSLTSGSFDSAASMTYVGGLERVGIAQFLFSFLVRVYTPYMIPHFLSWTN
ncbi:hypothetical protein DPMN_035011 [Dreissena polymorpha]|uniref:Uncharacterized protein n=1 Tax=Dreissena polymorpha TaxID=45954 RepID=A0A9D4MB40_DREPO|nr:hypothetical protein DPMN_035011 [Dreissena polymorpha]